MSIENSVQMFKIQLNITYKICRLKLTLYVDIMSPNTATIVYGQKYVDT